jgi:hypothetical protein
VDVPAAEDGPIGVVTFDDVVGAGADFSATTFDFGTCITDVKPPVGEPGDTLIITGVGFQSVTAVTFTGAGATEVQAIFTLTSDTETTDTITVTVPVGAVDGPLTVKTPGGNPTFDFKIGKAGEARSISLRLRKHLIAKGRVTADDPDCAASVPVKIQRKKKGGGWKVVKLTTTSSTGKYAKKIKDRPGKYRARAPKVTLESGTICVKAVSPRVKHRH